MSSNSRKILKRLSEKPAVKVEILTQDPLAYGTHPSQGEKKNKYAISRALKNLIESGYVEKFESPLETYAKITKKGRVKLNTLSLENDNVLVPQTWDGYWRIILIDLPENRKSERESLRYLLKKAGFVCLKNSAWISPYPYEHLFTNIKNDLGLTTEMIIIVSDKIDEASRRVFLESF